MKSQQKIECRQCYHEKYNVLCCGRIIRNVDMLRGKRIKLETCFIFYLKDAYTAGSLQLKVMFEAKSMHLTFKFQGLIEIVSFSDRDTRIMVKK